MNIQLYYLWIAIHSRKIMFKRLLGLEFIIHLLVISFSVFLSYRTSLVAIIIFLFRRSSGTLGPSLVS